MPFPNEFASGDSLAALADNPSVREFQGEIRFDDQATPDPPSSLSPERDANRVNRVIAIDGSTVTKQVRNGYPGAEAALFNMAAIVIHLDKLRAIPKDHIPGSREMREMEEAQTLSAVLPGRNVVRKTNPDDSPMRYFRSVVQIELGARLDPNHETLLETLIAISTSRGDGNSIRCPVEDCPNAENGQRVFPMRQNACPCDMREILYRADGLRIHERFEETGSSQQAYTAFMSVVEHLTLVNILRHFENTNTLSILDDTAFIMDGPLAVFGMPAWIMPYIRDEIARIHNISIGKGGLGTLIMGIEKTGAFMEHLLNLDWDDSKGRGQRLPNRTALVPDDDYIGNYIVLKSHKGYPYGNHTHYGRKIMYKNAYGQRSVILTPIVNEHGRDPNCIDEAAYPRIGDALDLMDELHTHLYEDAFAPLTRAHAHAAIPLRAGERILEKLFGEQ